MVTKFRATLATVLAYHAKIGITQLQELLLGTGIDPATVTPADLKPLHAELQSLLDKDRLYPGPRHYVSQIMANDARILRMVLR